jgi:hypothetical protein
VRKYVKIGKVETKPFRRRRFPRKYGPADIVLLTEADRAHQRLSGPAYALHLEARASGVREERICATGGNLVPSVQLAPRPAISQTGGGVRKHAPQRGLDRRAQARSAMSDTECAKQMSAAKVKLLRACKSESPIPPPRFL